MPIFFPITLTTTMPEIAANPNGEGRRAYFMERIGAWSQLISNAVG